MKKTVMRSAALVVALCMMLTVFASCGGASIVGKWQTVDGGQVHTIEFTQDGQVLMDGQMGANYVLSGDNTVLMTRGNQTKALTYVLNGDIAMMTADGETLTFNRVK